MSTPSPDTAPPAELVLRFACADRAGIVHAVTGFLLAQGCTVTQSQQYGDPDSGRFFMRVQFRADPRQPSGTVTQESVTRQFTSVAEQFGMTWHLSDQSRRQRILLMAGTEGHCLNDLLFRWDSGALPVDILGVVSNHTALARMVDSYRLPFHHLPVMPAGKREAERQLLALVEQHRIDLVVLARYMQILSPGLCAALSGRAINIHHSILPSFKGAKPYHQAHRRGVKIIGATAHYVTTDLDEGPIIEQDIARIDHALTPAQVVALGRDVEAQVLARAVRWHTEERVLLNGTTTVVFR